MIYKIINNQICGNKVFRGQRELYQSPNRSDVVSHMIQSINYHSLNIKILSIHVSATFSSKLTSLEPVRVRGLLILSSISR